MCTKPTNAAKLIKSVLAPAVSRCFDTPAYTGSCGWSFGHCEASSATCPHRDHLWHWHWTCSKSAAHSQQSSGQVKSLYRSTCTVTIIGTLWRCKGSGASKCSHLYLLSFWWFWWSRCNICRPRMLCLLLQCMCYTDGQYTQVASQWGWWCWWCSMSCFAVDNGNIDVVSICEWFILFISVHSRGPGYGTPYCLHHVVVFPSAHASFSWH